jgi:preprotein translocase subunit YajC
MFNLPFPTDSLYKFAFMFGLVLIVFSFYYKDQQLNRFDKKQSYSIIDSIKIVKSNTINAFWWDSLSMDRVVKHFKAEENKLDEEKLKKDVLKGAKGWRTYIYNKLDSSITGEFNNILNNPQNKDAHTLLKYTYDLNKSINVSAMVIIKGYQRNIDNYSLRINQDTQYFEILICLGIVLFVLGTLGWYFMIQRPQDKLLLLQVEQLNKQNTESYNEYLEWKKNK